MAIGDIVKVVMVRLRTDGAAAAKADMAGLAEQARALGRMDPTVNVKVDKDAAMRLRAMRLQVDALKLAGDKPGLQALAREISALGIASDNPRVKLSALRLAMLAMRDTIGNDRPGGGGLLGSLLMLIGKGGGGGLGAGGIAAGGLTGAVGLAGVAMAALAIVPALVAAGAGLAAFGGLAFPTFQRLTDAISTVIHAVNNYQSASQNLDDAIRKSPADWKAYQATIQGIEPDLRAAAQLLTNQNATWQSLSPSMQKAVTALADNKAELKALLPDQRAALAALLKQRDAWNNLTPAQQKAAASALSISSALMSMEQAVAPLVTTVINDLLQIANQLLPAILPLATAAGNALVGLFGNLAGSLKLTTTHIDGFVGSGRNMREIVSTTLTPFGEFVKKLTALSGPAITAIGEGLGRITAALGKLLLALASPASIRDTTVFFEILAGAINGLAAFFAWAGPRFNNSVREVTNWGRTLRHWFDIVRSNVVDFARNVKRWFEDARRDFDHMTSTIMTWAHDAVRWFDDFRHKAAVIFDGARHEIAHIWDMIWNNTIGRIIRGVGDAGRWFTTMKLRIGTIINELPGILFRAGVNAMKSLISGLGSMLGALGNMASSIVSKIAGFFGLSPAREGPLSGGGSMQIRGQHLVRDLARGIAMETGSAGSAAGLLARSVIPGTLGAGAGGGGWIDARVSYVPTGDPVIDAIFRGLRLKIRTVAGGGPQSVQRALGQVWR